jgi:uncharacterized protein YdeI (YjbR/CyaY-like superfamily)
MWLEKNHATAGSVWLIIYKKDSGTPSVVYAEAVEEALCFGRVDSKPNKRDDKSYVLYFAARKPKSPWSKINKERVARLIKEKKMHAAGLAKINAAKKDGSWSVLDSVEALIMPGELKKVISKNKKALTHFEAFPPSVKKGIYQWIQSAKTDETREKRITETVNQAEKNIRANQWRG